MRSEIVANPSCEHRPLTPFDRQGNTAFATSVGLLVVRLVLGWTFIFHGLQLTVGAFGGPGLEGMAKNLHLPLLPPIVWAGMAAYGQLVGGITTFLGLLTRAGSLLVIINMLVAIATVHGANGFSSQHQPVPGYEYNLNLVAESVLLLIAGPGLVSLDALLFRRGFWARGAQPLQEPSMRVVA